MNFIKSLFAIEKSPKKGLMALEWVVLAYMALTLLMVFFTYTKLANPESMIWGRVRIGIIIVALWIVYRLVPCRFTKLTRVVAQLYLLSWWYPDTYELNRILPNLDHVFAQAEQSVFGFQPALVFCDAMPSAWFSELMDMGYASYFPMILAVTLFYFFCRYAEFERASFVLIAAFFIYYVVFVALPVTGPQYYYPAVGMEKIAMGIFPNVGDYFNLHSERLTSPGYANGIFYQMVEHAHEAGERPTAAFPSSHVGISTVIMLLAWHTRNRRLVFCLLPFFVLMCFSTVYIMAHYAIDAFAGLISGALLYVLLMWVSRKWSA